MAEKIHSIQNIFFGNVFPSLSHLDILSRYKSIYNVSWLQAAGIAILAIIFTIVIQIILSGIFIIPFLPYPKLPF